MKDASNIIAESLNSFRQRVADLESKLSIGVLYGQGFMILAKCEGMQSELVLGRFDRPGHYAANAPQVFCALDITPDHLCGVSLYDREQAARVIESCKKDPYLASVTAYDIRHIRAEQMRRLENWRAMVKTLEDIQAKQATA